MTVIILMDKASIIFVTRFCYNGAVATKTFAVLRLVGAVHLNFHSSGEPIKQQIQGFIPPVSQVIMATVSMYRTNQWELAEIS